MALGDVTTLDDPSVSVGGTDISDAVASCQFRFTYRLVEVPNTFGAAGPRRRASEKYDFQVTLDVITDGFDAGELDKVMTALMPAPLGASTTGGLAEIIIKPDSGATAATNPSYTGNIVIHEWDPIGSGVAGDIIRNSHTFMGAGDLAVATS